MLTAILLVQALAAAAPETAPALTPNTAANMQDLKECVALSESDPEAAYERARSWAALTRRWEAYVCSAIADIGRGRPDVGARQLERLAGASDASPAADRVELYSKAGNAWILAGNAAGAQASFSAALAIAPADADLRIDRARAYAMDGNYRLAEEDLSAALDARPNDALALRLRSETRLRRGAYALAVRDAEAAFAIAPLEVDAALALGRAREAERLGAVPE